MSMSKVPKGIIVNFLKHTISRKEEQILYKWLQDDKQNLEIFCQLLEKWDDGLQMPEEKIRQSWNELRKQLETPRPRLYPVRWMRYAAAAAVVLVVLFGGWFTLQTYKTEAPVAQYIINNLGNSVQKHILPDSSIVWLHEGCRISYSQTFIQDRQLKMEGLAYFEVRKNTTNPFVVHTGNSYITVT